MAAVVNDVCQRTGALLVADEVQRAWPHRPPVLPAALGLKPDDGDRQGAGAGVPIARRSSATEWPRQPRSATMAAPMVATSGLPRGARVPRRTDRSRL
jgi:hypothetical protein